MTTFRSPNIDRLLKVLLREGEPDLVPFYEHFADNEIIEALTGKPVSNELLRGGISSKRYLETLIEFYNRLGYDYVPLEVPLKLPRKNTLQTHDMAYLSRGMRSWEDENRGTIETVEDFDKYPWPDPEEAAELSAFENLAEALPEGMGVVGGVAGGVFEHVSWLMSLGKLCRAVHLDKKLVKRMFDKVGSLILSVDEVIVEEGHVDVLRMGDDLGYKTGTFLPPRVLREYVFPYYKKLVDLAHRNGLPFIIHSCGNLYVPDGKGRSVMDDLVEYVGIDAKHSFEDEIMPICQVKKRYEGKIAVLGGIDMNKLVQLSGADLRKYVRCVIKRCAPGGAYALGSGNTIANYVPLENYLTMLDEGLKHGTYPISAD
ncbi:MAG: uroporphyrinogen decarboxylase family protein [Candidatus Bathyarchaeia archaeon]